MKIYYWILTLIVALIGIWLITNFIYIAFLVPHGIPEQLPDDFEAAITELNRSTDNLEFIQKAYDFVNSRYTSLSYKYLTQPEKLFTTNAEEIWYQTGYQPCDKQTYILQLILIKSGRFQPNEIKIRSILSLRPHQYLEINLNQSKIALDMWGADHGVAFGNYYKFPSLFKI